MIEFLVVEGLKIMMGGGANGIVVGLKRLQDDFAAQNTPAGSAGHLGQDLEGALGSAVIGQVEAGVGGDHPH